MATISYKRTSDSSWTDIPLLSLNRLTINGLNFSFETDELLDSSSQPIRFDENTAYDFRIRLRDAVGQTTEYVRDIVIPKATGVVTILARTNTYQFPRVGINQATPTEALDVVGNIKLSGVIKTPTGQVMSFVESTDASLSNYKNTGMYFVPYVANSYAPSDMPTSAPGFLEVYATDTQTGGYVFQRFTAASTAAVYVRTYYGTSTKSWSSWISL